ncbi:MAG TPA: (2Fe-2S) ferredoxin domain-containing protein [Candidatus Borkfalkia faecigallinarum]|uniref:(2Fe-2S) ferredoxin domain-containing protein n=1 Tax=Candidatus Borkfalkia faecigallinarum TaxID=2838509 RepID=A0A9D1VSK8_9FIRM|nr:(2Fe-2S) ferredoxin domain-containing protein [Candidatus Borkfalkia faecigallinarum]
MPHGPPRFSVSGQGLSCRTARRALHWVRGRSAPRRERGAGALRPAGERGARFAPRRSCSRRRGNFQKILDERRAVYYNGYVKEYRRGTVMVLKVCVGSSCHLRGSYDVIEEMKRLIKKYGVEDKVDLQATFCVGNCTNGVSVLADEVLLHNANKDNCEELFLTQVYPLLGK